MSTADGDCWLSRCKGFRVDSPDGRIGTVQDVRFGSGGRPDALAVRAGLVGHRLLIVSTHTVAAVVPGSRRVVLRDEERDYFLYDRLEEWNGEANVGRHAEIERLPRDGVVEALAAVPHDERDAVVLVDVGEFSHVDAARILGLPPEALPGRLHRGRRILKARLAEEIGAVV